MTSNCAYEVAITGLYITDAMCVPEKTSFDQAYLEVLLDKVSTVSRASHRPRNTVGGAHIQPQDDTIDGEDMMMMMMMMMRARMTMMTTTSQTSELEH